MGDFTFYSGGNPDLRPEDSRSVSVGVVFDINVIDGFRVSADWINIKKRDNVSAFGLSQTTLNDEDLIPGLIVRDAPADGYDFGVITGYRAGFVNVARQDVSALDFSIDYSLKSKSVGDFLFSASGTKNVKNKIQVISSLPVRDQLKGSLLEWSANAALDWIYGDFSLSWSSTYYDSYCISIDCSLTPIGVSGRVAAQMYHDINLVYDYGGSAFGVMDGFSIKAGVMNVTNEVPGLIATPPYYSNYGSPMLRSYFAAFSMRF